jgi:hypothetical protein
MQPAPEYLIVTGAIVWNEEFYPVVEREYNRLTVLDPDKKLEGAIGDDVVVYWSDKRIVGSWTCNSDGTASLSVWGVE